MTKRVVLAYSGGLDTSVAVRWIREEWGYEVIACAVDVGQLKPGETELIHERARAAGAVEVEVIDARDQFAAETLVPALQANAMYEGKYPLVSALSRPVIVEHLVASARRHNADAVGHGCTGKGNDQVRFEVSSRILAPDLEVLAPVRVWGLTRADCIDLAAKWEIPIEATKGVVGHLLGAAGAVEAIFSVLAINSQVAPPTINLDEPDEGCDLDFVPHTARNMDIDVVLSNSFGFGGTNGSLVFRRFAG